MIKIGDAAVSEEKIVETNLNSPEVKEKTKSEKKSTSSKKSKSKKQSRGIKIAKGPEDDAEKELSNFKNNFYFVFVECERSFTPESGSCNSDFFEFQSGKW